MASDEISKVSGYTLVPALPGEDVHGRYGIKDVHGQAVNVDTCHAVCPLLKTVDGSFQIIGTCFYISPNGLFATARHVLVEQEAIIQAEDLRIFQPLDNDEALLRRVSQIALHDSFDLAVGLARPLNYGESGKEFINQSLVLTDVTPSIGKDVVTFAFPNTKVVITPTIVTIVPYPAFYGGQIQDILSEGNRTRLEGPGYQCSFHMHSGASGGPVMLADSGLVIGVNTSSFEGARDISYVSSIKNIVSISLQGAISDSQTASVTLSNSEESQRPITIGEFCERGFVRFAPPLKR